MFPIILIVIIVACLGTIAYIVIKKFPKLAAVNARSNILKQASVKKRLLEERFERHFKNGGKKIIGSLKPMSKKFGPLVKSWYQKLIHLEEFYRHKVLKDSFKDEVIKEQQIEKMLNSAEEFINQEKFEEAEKKFIEILSLDEKNVGAYKGLGGLYLVKKDYEHAKETFEFLLKIAQDDPGVYKSLGEIASKKGDLKMAEEDYLKSLDINKEDTETYLKLAEVYLNLENPQAAFKVVEQALTLEPNNPRVLDFFIEISIIVQDKAAALKAYMQLKEANPENQKLSELKKKIDKL